MRIEILLLCLIACLPSNSVPVINLPDRTSVGQPPPHYDPCVRSYAQPAQFGIEEHICVDSMGNNNVQEYFDTVREYPCTWQLTKDGKTRCIPAQQVWNYYAHSEFMTVWDTECVKPIALMEVDAFQHSRSWYVAIPDHKGKYSVHEVGGLYTDKLFWLPYWSENREIWECTSLLPIDDYYPRPGKGHKWFFVGQEVEPSLFQER